MYTPSFTFIPRYFFYLIRTGNYGPDGEVWKACNRPYLQFDMEALWAETPPSIQ